LLGQNFDCQFIADVDAAQKRALAEKHFRQENGGA
jgi:hypothetical protein